MSRKMRAIFRGALSLSLFGLFGVGALLLAPLMFLARHPEKGQPLVRAAWRFILSLFCLSRLIRIDRTGLGRIHGSVIAANHPSLIDVVILTALIPRTLYVAKSGLRSNPFLSAIVRATALPDDANLPEVAAPYLASGWNVLIFPEGTRSPERGGLQPLRRGAVQLALRTGAPLAAVRMDVTRHILGKHQPPWEMGDRRITYSLHSSVVPCTRHAEESLHQAAVRLTDTLRQSLA